MQRNYRIIGLTLLVCAAIFWERDRIFFNDQDVNRTAQLSTLEQESVIQAQSGSCTPRYRIMHLKNYKVGGTTLSSIIFKIATKYQKYTITSSCKDQEWNMNSDYGYLLHHCMQKSAPNMLDMFPRPQFFWVSSVREPLSQFYSRTSFSNIVADFMPDKLAQTLEEGTSISLMAQLTKTLMPECLSEAGYLDQECGRSVLDKYDLIIPLEHFDDGLVMMSQRLCLPIEDFAYLRDMKKSKSYFKLNETIEHYILEKFKRNDQWLYHESRKIFLEKLEVAKKDSEFMSKREALKKASIALTNACVSKDSEEDNGSPMEAFRLNSTMLRRHNALTTTCLSFVTQPYLNPFAFPLMEEYNEYLRAERRGTTKTLEDAWHQIAEKSIDNNFY